jgi:hypothetical protein
MDTRLTRPGPFDLERVTKYKRLAPGFTGPKGHCGNSPAFSTPGIIGPENQKQKT